MKSRQCNSAVVIVLVVMTAMSVFMSPSGFAEEGAYTGEISAGMLKRYCSFIYQAVYVNNHFTVLVTDMFDSNADIQTFPHHSRNKSIEVYANTRKYWHISECDHISTDIMIGDIDVGNINTSRRRPMTMYTIISFCITTGQGSTTSQLIWRLMTV